MVYTEVSLPVDAVNCSDPISMGGHTVRGNILCDDNVWPCETTDQ